MKRSFLTPCLLWLLAMQCLAHEGLYEQLAKVTQQIRTEPNNGSLYLKRGELYRQLRQWQNALSDYDRASRINPLFGPLLVETEFLRGRMWLQAAQPKLAERSLSLFLQAKPESAEAWLLRARAFEQLKKHREASADFTRAIELTSQPKPDVFIERAKAQLNAKQPEEALSGLEFGIARLGQIVTLQLQAIEIELKLKRWDAALNRLDQISAQSLRKESWLARRGEILLLAGRKPEAQQAFKQSLLAIENLPANLRQTRAIEELKRTVKRRLD